MRLKKVLKSKGVILLVILLLTLGIFTGCSQEQNSSTSEVHLEDTIKIVCDIDGEIKLSIIDLMALNQHTVKITRERDDGVEEYEVKGALFTEVLASIDKDISSLDIIRITAGDGYSIEVPNQVLMNRDIILAYEIDGEPLHDETRPIRIFIPQERAMYWVSNTVEIGLASKEDNNDTASLNEILFLETVISKLDEVEYEGDQKAVKTYELLESIDASKSIYMLAVDGFEKNEEYDTFISEYIVFEGEDTPAFRGPDIPRGMHVRDIVFISTGETGLFSVERGMEIFKNIETEDNIGISLKEIVDEYGLKKADKYILEAIDGYYVVLGYEDLSLGVVYIGSKGEISVFFNGLPRNVNVKELVSIRAAE